MNCATCNAMPRLPKDSYCRDCRNTYNREWHHNHPGKMQTYRKRIEQKIETGEHEPHSWEPGKPGRPPRGALDGDAL